MVFAGKRCKVYPLPADYYLRTGKMPAILTHIAFTTGDARAQIVESATPDEAIETYTFQRMAVCRVLAEPRVVDEAEGAQIEKAISYTQLAERFPAFVDAILFWVLSGCPAPEKGGEGISTEALAGFSEKPTGTKRARARTSRKAHGRAPVAVAEG